MSEQYTKQLEDIKTKEIPDLIDINRVYLLYGEWLRSGIWELGQLKGCGGSQGMKSGHLEVGNGSGNGKKRLHSRYLLDRRSVMLDTSFVIEDQVGCSPWGGY